MKCPALILLAAACLVSGCGSSRSHEVCETKNRGYTIIIGLMRFHSDTGTYPPNLELLIPKYLNKIPQPAISQQTWRYKVSKDQKRCVLEFNAGSNFDPTYYWEPGYSEWAEDTK
jgi:hypothetical protein